MTDLSKLISLHGKPISAFPYHAGFIMKFNNFYSKRLVNSYISL